MGPTATLEAVEEKTGSLSDNKVINFLARDKDRTPLEHKFPSFTSTPVSSAILDPAWTTTSSSALITRSSLKEESLSPTTPVEEAVQTAPIAISEVYAVQREWAASIVAISNAYLEGGDYVQAASDAATALYSYGESNVLFKPTKAAKHQFRSTGMEAMSYFVGANAVIDGIEEDTGFAINGGKGWKKVEFDNHRVEVEGTVAMAMGNYYFTCATTGDRTKVEYTFAYKRSTVDDKLRIILHHSSVPFNP
ncbi:MAG: hypothetical protein SGPRY_008313 [Prymnesium sp.]